MITQRITYNADGTVDLVIHGDAIGIGEVTGLYEELNLRSTVATVATVYVLNESPLPDPDATTS